MRDPPDYNRVKDDTSDKEDIRDNDLDDDHDIKVRREGPSSDYNKDDKNENLRKVFSPSASLSAARPSFYPSCLSAGPPCSAGGRWTGEPREVEENK